MVQEEKIGLEDLRVGDIMVFPAPEGSKLSQVIALLTDSSVSHAALMYKTGSEFYLQNRLLEVYVPPRYHMKNPMYVVII